MSDQIYSIDDIKSIMNRIMKKVPVKRVTLFGSYANKTANKKSDLDLVIDSNGQIMGFALFSLIDEIENSFQKQVDAFEKCEIIENSKIDKEIKKNGVIVYEK